MLTPQEVAQHAFTKATFGGYNMSMVDEFLDVLTEDYTALYKENAVLKSKMKVLVDKIEEYRSTEEAMRSALLTAQKMANSLVAEAEDKKAQLLREAENVANARIMELHHDIASEEMRLAAAQRATAEFTAKMREMLAHEIAFLDSLPELEAPAPATPVTDEVAQTVKAIEDSMQKLMNEEVAAAHAAEPAEEDLADTKDVGDAFQKAEEANLYDKITAFTEEDDLDDEADEDDDEDAGRRIDFANLQFGKDYEIT